MSRKSLWLSTRSPWNPNSLSNFSQGNLIAANDQFEVGMGTLATYVGVAPDPNNPGQVIPVWGTAELLNLEAQAKVQVNGAWADPLIVSVGIHPEPGQPDHLVTPNTFTFWNGYSTYTSSSGQQTASGALVFDDAHLQDVFDNTTYGYTTTAATQPDPNVAVQFSDQTSGAYDDFSAYAVQMTWQADATGQMPAGTFASTLSVTYPSDAAGEVGMRLRSWFEPSATVSCYRVAKRGVSSSANSRQPASSKKP